MQNMPHAASHIAIPRGNYLTPDAAAVRLNVSLNTIRNYRLGGMFPGALKVGNSWLYPLKEVDAAPTKWEILDARRSKKALVS